jgi:nicotinate-nucleotide adenylyltransferase
MEFVMDKEIDNKILLFGGTFDPIHNGHLIMAQQAVEAFGFNEVIFIPSATPPHKTDSLSVYHRLKMTKLATYGVNYFKVSTVEEKREGPSYTYDTVMHFREEYPDATIYWLIGTDSISKLKTWYKIKELVHECQFIIAERDPYKFYKGHNGSLFDFLSEECQTFLKADFTNHFKLLLNSVIEISSTDIRRRIKEKKDYATWFYMNENVEKYINDNQLYSDKS